MNKSTQEAREYNIHTGSSKSPIKEKNARNPNDKCVYGKWNDHRNSMKTRELASLKTND